MRKEIIIASTILLLATSCYVGDPDRGEALFSNPSFGKGTNGKTCQTCHDKGLDLSVELMDKRNFEVMGVEVTNPAEAVNFCIEVTLRGEGIAPESKDMADILAWLEILALRSGGKKYNP